MEYLLEAHNITKRYANHTALQDVSLKIPRGSVFGLLGPNGAGKTSLIRIINQITGPDSGEIRFNGKALMPEHVHKIGYLPEERGLYKKMKIGEQCVYLARLKGMSKSEAENRLKYWFKRFDIADWWEKKVEELSKGMAQKVQFITTVLHNPEFIILDEPFSGFDPINANLIKEEIQRLRDEGATVMLSTHNMNSVEEICSDIVLINNASVVLSGEMTEVRNRFKDALYEVQYRGQVLGFTNALWTRFELLENKANANGNQVAQIKIKDGSSVNDLLQSIIPVVEVQMVREVLPSMNDIFIKIVQQKEVSHE